MKIILLPLSLLFRLIVFIRNKLYDWNIIKQRELNSRVISIGNIAAGGTGKTPFVELIAEHILSKGKFAVIIQKGYKRESDDLKVCEHTYLNEDHKLNSENFGDEGLLLLENLNKLESPGRCLLIVCDKKTSAAKFADTKFKPDVIILDDGFQHRKIARDLDIVLISDSKRDSLIPAGLMREPFSSVFRSDLIVVNNKFDGDMYVAPTKHKPRITCFYSFEGLIDLKDEIRNTENMSVIAFCGIAEPDSFMKLLEKQKISVSDFMIFPDHHSFTIEDIIKIQDSFKRNKAAAIVTTQKDFVRIKNSELVLVSSTNNVYKELLTDYPLCYAKIKMQISANEEILFEKIDKLME